MDSSKDCVLAVFAHPDDEILCGAGTLALLAARGVHVTLLCCTRGELGPIVDDSLATREMLPAVRERELRASCAALGIGEVRLLDLPDGGVDWAAHERGTLDVLVQLVRKLRPKLVITFGADGLYGHTDHVAVSELMSEARRVAADRTYGTEPERAYQIPRVFHPVLTGEYVADLLAQLSAAGQPAQLWSLQPENFHVTASAITARVDVSRVLDAKLRALHSHRTQFAADNALALLRGELAVRFLGTEYFRCADGLPGDPLSV